MVTTFVPTRKSSSQPLHDVALLCVLQAGRIVAAPPATTVHDGLRIGREVAGEGGLSIGDDTMMSRTHATLRRREGAFFIADSSSNGTFVNGTRCAEAPLQDRDVVRMGRTMFVVRHIPQRRARDATSLATSSTAALRGTSGEMQKLRTTIDLMAPTSSTVLLLGETGSGKEVAARAVHDGSGRRGPFVALNCAAIPETLAEAQLFGHVAGAFTGAKAAAPGAFRAAQGGTLFLDEIGELPAPVQAKLLRVLESQEVTPVGSTDSIRLDVRVVCATHRELVRQTARGTFRGDLYARVAELVIRLPPLRERREDILLLLLGFLGAGPLPLLDVELAERLLLHPWPFNVRELRKLSAQLALHRHEETFSLDLVADRLLETASIVDESTVAPASMSSSTTSPPSWPPSPGSTLESASAPASSTSQASRPPVASRSEQAVAPRGAPTRDELIALLQKHGGNIVRIAREAGRSRKSVYRWLEQHGLSSSDHRVDNVDADADEGETS